MNKDKDNEIGLYILVVCIVILLGLLVFVCVTNKTEIDKLKKDVTILINKEK